MKATEHHYFDVAMIIMLFKVFVAIQCWNNCKSLSCRYVYILSLKMKPKSVIIPMKVTHEQGRFHVMAFMVLCQVAIRFIVICGDFKVINWALISYSQSCTGWFQGYVCTWNLGLWPFIWKLSSLTLMWYWLSCSFVEVDANFLFWGLNLVLGDRSNER